MPPVPLGNDVSPGSSCIETPACFLSRRIALGGRHVIRGFGVVLGLSL